MIPCRLTLFGEGGKRAPDVPVQLAAPVPPQAELDRIHRDYISGKGCRYAVVREGRIVHALFLASDLLPERSVLWPSAQNYPGRWASTALSLGSNTAMRAITGPALFFRQLDLQPEESWMAPVLMRFHQGLDCRERVFGAAKVHEWDLYDQKYFVARHRQEWRLYCGGNTPTGRIDAVRQRLGEEVPVRTFLWEIGAIPLVGVQR